MKMAFDVTEAYNHLLTYGIVYTLRPTQSYVKYRTVRVHLHRHGQWTGHLASKTIVAFGSGKSELREVLHKFQETSGFNSVDEWIKCLVSMHGKYIMLHRWGIFLVTLYPGRIYLERLHQQ